MSASGRHVSGVFEERPRKSNELSERLSGADKVATERHILTLMSKQAEATALFQKTFNDTNRSWTIISSLRRVSKAGKPFAAEIIERENKEYADRFMETFEAHGITEGMTVEETDQLKAGLGSAEYALQGATAAVDAASLIFAHAVLDAAAFGYCQVSALAEPMDWFSSVKEKQVSIEYVKDNSFELALEQAINKHLEQLEMGSLLKKIDLLYKVCKPGDKFSCMDGYLYDRSEIDRLDKLRHSIIHSSSLHTSITISEKELDYMQKTCVHLMALINLRYKLRLL